MSGGININNCEDLCAFISATQAHPELIQMALRNPHNLNKIQYTNDISNVIEALINAGASAFIPLVLTAKVLAKARGGVDCWLPFTIHALKRAGLSERIPLVLTAEVLAKLSSGFDAALVIRALSSTIDNFSKFIPSILTAEFLRKIKRVSDLCTLIYELRTSKASEFTPAVLTAEVLSKVQDEAQLKEFIGALWNARHIATVLASDVIREKFPEVCYMSFCRRFWSNPDLQTLVREALQILDAPCSDPRTAATVVMGAGASAGGGVGAAASEVASAKINNCEDLCAFIKAHSDSRELIERTLNSPDVQEKIRRWVDVRLVIKALWEAKISELIPIILVPEVLRKLTPSENLGLLIKDLDRITLTAAIPYLLTDEVLGSNICNRLDLISLVKTLASLNALTFFAAVSGYPQPPGSTVFDIERTSLQKDIALIGTVLSSLPMKKFLPTSEGEFVGKFSDQSTKNFLVRAFVVARWNPRRAAWVGAVVRSGLSGERRTTAAVKSSICCKFYFAFS
jgi:hypothetical protein